MKTTPPLRRADTAPRIAAKDTHQADNAALRNAADAAQRRLSLNEGPPEKAGLYWVKDKDHGLMLAVCEGVAPFLSVMLVDLWDHYAPRVAPKPGRLAQLKWLGEIVKPIETEAGGPS